MDRRVFREMSHFFFFCSWLASVHLWEVVSDCFDLVRFVFFLSFFFHISFAYWKFFILLLLFLSSSSAPLWIGRGWNWAVVNPQHNISASREDRFTSSQAVWVSEALAGIVIVSTLRYSSSLKPLQQTNSYRMDLDSECSKVLFGESQRASEDTQAWGSGNICKSLGLPHSCKQWLAKPWLSSSAAWGWPV